MSAILVVDDDGLVRRSLTRLLERAGYQCTAAASVREARERLREASFDLIVSDIRLQGESGIDLLREVSRQLPDVAVLMLTGFDDPDVAREALEIGAYAYIVKPFEQNEIVLAVENGIRRRDIERGMRKHVEELEDKVLERSKALRQALAGLQHQAVSSATLAVQQLSKALALRDEETGQHIERMSRYAACLARANGSDGPAADEVRFAAMLHDVGKIGVPDGVLLKPGPLTAGESDIIKRHPEMGHRLLAGSPSPIIGSGATIALTHHERWDGAGYPAGLTREEIPVNGRIAAIADVFDALTSKRVYRPAYTVAQTVEIMQEQRAKHFDPELLDLFLEHLDEVDAIRDEFPDAEHDAVIRVMIVDDHPMFADSLVRVLQREEDMELTGSAGSIAEAVEMARALQPDVILLDWQLPDGIGSAAAERIRVEVPEVRILILTGLVDEAIARAAVEAGCSGYLTKTQAADEVAIAVREAYAGEARLPASMVRSMFSRIQGKDAGPRVGRLTARETEILSLLAGGDSNEVIAEGLGLSINTVRNHVQNVITKLGAHSKLEAVAISVRRGMITLSPKSELS